MKRALFPGSFDPLTLGHFDIINRGLKVFDEVIVAIGINADKSYMFSLEERLKFIKEAFKDQPKVKVMTYKGLTIETVFLLTAASTSYISSSIVRDVIRNKGDYTVLVPDSVRVL